MDVADWAFMNEFLQWVALFFAMWTLKEVVYSMVEHIAAIEARIDVLIKMLAEHDSRAVAKAMSGDEWPEYEKRNWWFAKKRERGQ